MSDSATTGPDEAEPLVPEPREFDPDLLRERYRIERDKRLRPDGNAQYLRIADEFAHYSSDPYVETPLQREPVTDATSRVSRRRASTRAF